MTRRVILSIVLLLLLAVVGALGAKDHYQILGVPRTADEKAIKKAYRKLAVKWHPDKHDGEAKVKAEKNFMRIAKAYETLSDPEKRRIYDQVGDEGVAQHEQQQAAGGGAGGFPKGGFPGGGFRFSTGGGSGGFDPFSIFETMFGSRGFPGGGGGMPRGGRRGGGGGGGGGGGAGGANLFAGTDVELITAQNAKSVLGKDLRRQDGRAWTIMFFAPWCGHCQKTKPAFAEFAKRAKGVFRVGAVDCDVSQSLCSHYKVQGFPTIISLLPESSDPLPYNGQRNAQDFYEHSQRLIPAKAVTVASSEEQAKALCDKAASKACVVVLSDKPTPSPLVKALAFRLRNTAQTILVKVTSPRKNPVFGTKEVSVPAIFVNGNQYKGLIRMDKIYAFVTNASKKKTKTEL